VRPITPQPGHSEADVVDALASKNFIFANCYTIAPLVGSSMYYTTARGDVTVVPLGGVMRQTYKAGTVLIAGLKAHNKIGVEVDEQTISLDYSLNPDYQARIPWPKALLQGLMDGATIRRDRFIALEWLPQGKTDWLGGMPMFAGRVSNLSSVGRQSAQLSVKSEINTLSNQMPRSLFTARCKNTWGDTACGVDKSLFAVTATVTSGTPTRTFLPWTSANASYVEGTVHMDNYDSVTRVRKIQKADNTGLWLAYPLDFDPVVGQTFTAWPGCAGTQTECQVYHPSDWQNRLKAFPYVPVVEQAY